MPILQNILLGIVTGQFLVYSQLDSIFWPYIGSDLSNLKSQIPLTHRNAMISFYRAISGSAANAQYFLLATVILLLLSFLGGIVQNNGAKRFLNAGSLLAFSGAVAVELIYSRPLIDAILNKKGGKVIENLFWLATSHFGICVLLLVTISLQISTEQDEVSDEELEEPEISKAKKE